MGPSAGTSAFVYAAEELELFGFRPADTAGRRLSREGVHSLDEQRAELFNRGGSNKKHLGLGILTQPNRPGRALFPFLQPKPMGSFIGILWFDNDALGAGGWTWVLEVYGQGHVGGIRRFAARLQRSLHAEIQIRVTRERARPEIDPPFRLFQGLEEIWP